MNLRTKENLVAAMHSEAFAYVRYMLFAKQARHNGRPDLAELFEKTATVGRLEHFAEEVALIDPLRSDADNLQAAIKGEAYEVTTMYPHFAAEAAAAGDKEVAGLFTEIANDEKRHLEAFRSALEEMTLAAR